MKKEMLSVLSLTAVIFSLGSCGKKDDTKPTPDPVDETTVYSAMKTLVDANELRAETTGQFTNASSSGTKTFEFSLIEEYSADAFYSSLSLGDNDDNKAEGGLVNLADGGVGAYFASDNSLFTNGFASDKSLFTNGYVDSSVAKDYSEFVITLGTFFDSFVEGKTAESIGTAGTFDVKEYSLDLSLDADGYFTSEVGYYEYMYLTSMLRLGSLTSLITDMTFKASNGLLTLETTISGSLYSRYTFSGTLTTQFLPESNEVLPTYDFTSDTFINAVKKTKLEPSEDFKAFETMVNENTYQVKDVSLSGGYKANVYYGKDYWGYVIGEDSETPQYLFYAEDASGNLIGLVSSSQTAYKQQVENVATAAQLKQAGITAEQYIKAQATQFGLSYIQDSAAFTYSFLASEYDTYMDGETNKGFSFADYGNAFGLGTILDSTDYMSVFGYAETGVIIDYNKGSDENSYNDDEVFFTYLIGTQRLLSNDDLKYTNFGTEFSPVYNYLHTTAA